MDHTPVSLIVRLRESDDAAAWRRFVEIFAPLLDQWARRLGLQVSDAEDLVQDVFTILVKQLPRFRFDPSRSFRSWLWTVLYHQHLRRQKKQQVEPIDVTEFDRLAPADSPPPFDEVEYRRFVVGRAVQIMQADFAPATWQACWELTVEGKPAVDIAKRLGISANAVYLAKARVLTRLRQELAGLME